MQQIGIGHHDYADGISTFRQMDGDPLLGLFHRCALALWRAVGEGGFGVAAQAGRDDVVHAIRFEDFQQPVGRRAKADQIGLYPHGLGRGCHQGGDIGFGLRQHVNAARIGQNHGAKIGGNHVLGA